MNPERRSAPHPTPSDFHPTRCIPPFPVAVRARVGNGVRMRWLVTLVVLLTAGCGTPAATEPPAPPAVTLRGLVVESVPADTGFWATTTGADRVWVKLILTGRSPIPVQAGERLDVTGVVVPHGPDFAAREGVTTAPDAELLTRQGSHVEVEQTDVRVVHLSAPGLVRL